MRIIEDGEETKISFISYFREIKAKKSKRKSFSVNTLCMARRWFEIR